MEQIKLEIEAAKRSDEKNKKPATQRPKKNRLFTTTMWEARMSINKNNSMNSMLTTYTTGERNCCKKPLNELTPITLSEMMVPKVHIGRYLLCRTITTPFKIYGILTLIEDTKGDIEDLSLYNMQQAFSDDPNKILPAQTILIIKEPYLKYGSMGENIFIRCDSPSDVIFVDETDEILKNTKWMQPLTDSFDKIKEKANNIFKSGDYENSIKLYTRALKIENNPVIYLNRSQAYLQLGRYYDAYNDAEKAYESNKVNNEKALYRMGKAAYGMQHWQKAIDNFQLLLKQYPDNKEATIELERSKARLNESQTGVYDLNKIYDDAYVKKIRYLDVADHVGPVEVVEIKKGYKGVVASRDITKGTLLVVSKAFSITTSEEVSNYFIKSVNLINKSMDLQSQAINLTKTINILNKHPNRANELYSLYAGSFDRSEQIPFGVIDTGRIEQICTYNSFSIEPILRTNEESKSFEEIRVTGTGTGLWILPSFFNHSCVANAYRTFYNDVIIIFAIKDIKKNEEIYISYFSEFISLKERSTKLSFYKINYCKCKLCELDRNDKFFEKRLKLYEEDKKQAYSMIASSKPEAFNFIIDYFNKIEKLYRNRGEYQLMLIIPANILAQMYMLKNEYEKAIQLLEKFENYYGDFMYYFNPFPFLNLAKCYKNCGKVRMAKMYVKKAVEYSTIRMGGGEQFF